MKKLILTLVFISFALLSGNKTFAQQAVKHLHGRYIMKSAGCAGFNFLSEKSALWYNEISCDEPDTLRIKWVDDNSFIAINKFQISKSCPPSVSYYKIVSNVGKQLVLKSVATGLVERKDDILTFIQK